MKVPAAGRVASVCAPPETPGLNYFTEYLMEALKMDQGQKTITEIYKHLEECVPDAVQAEKGGAQQHPQMRSYPASRREIKIRIGSPETGGQNDSNATGRFCFSLVVGRPG